MRALSICGLSRDCAVTSYFHGTQRRGAFPKGRKVAFAQSSFALAFTEYRP